MLENVPLDKVADFEKQLLQLLNAKHRTDVLDVIRSGALTDDATEKLVLAARDVAARF